MKKAILSTALLSAVFLGSIQVASAAEVKQEKTPVGIEFEKITGQGEGPFKGALSLTYKPSALDFGKFKSGGAFIDAAAVNISDDNKQWLIINDDRDYPAPTTGDTADGKGGTWELTAKMSDLKDASGKTLPTKLTMNFGGIQNYNMGTEVNPETGDYIPNNPNDTGVVKPFEEGKAPKVDLTSAVTLEAGKLDTEVKVMTKKEATSEKMGGVASQLTSANLNVQNKGYEGGKLSSEITWTLSTGIK
ncbi:WxL domain-containing protein [uncultured Vagococcus sp.]|uniref:WxL domain-containing protein n=1 Tax=uncultured Vagococcus sp. TaxID=189676 RepID=UPI0025841554|nr:WxL domain-containing protein [uncultured Vagococcus sp.]